jgi:hypothetical protein
METTEKTKSRNSVFLRWPAVNIELDFLRGLGVSAVQLQLWLHY